jgi:hypothetical protein
MLVAIVRQSDEGGGELLCAHCELCGHEDYTAGVLSSDYHYRLSVCNLHGTRTHGTGQHVHSPVTFAEGQRLSHPLRSLTSVRSLAGRTVLLECYPLLS